jgi:hypothetical protein
LSSDQAQHWYRELDDGVAIRVRLTPKGGRDGIDGPTALSDGSAVLAARVRAAPEKGTANKALEKLIADALGVARANVSVASGHKARLKTVHVAGDAAELARMLGRLDTRKTKGTGK